MSDPPRKRLVISEDDLAAPPVPPPATHPQAAPGMPSVPAQDVPAAQAPSFPTVQGVPVLRVGVGDPGQTVAPLGTAFVRSVQGRNITAAACAIVVGWAFCEITHFGLWTATSTLGQDATVGAYTGAVGFFFAVIYAGWEKILARSWDGTRDAIVRAGPSGFGLAFVAGFVAEIVYRHFVTQIIRGLTLGDLFDIQSNVKLYLTRALAWGLFGLGMGVAVAGGFKSKEKLINGVVGGAVGGAGGGLVFHWASFNISSEPISRGVGLLVIGLSIGLAIGVVEKVRRDAWLQIIGGPMAGKEFIVYGSTYTFGSSPKCDVTLIKDAAVRQFHAVIRTVEGPAGQSRVLDAYDGCPVLVNGSPSTHHRLRAGDVIGLGSTTIAYSERATAV